MENHIEAKEDESAERTEISTYIKITPDVLLGGQQCGQVTRSIRSIRISVTVFIYASDQGFYLRHGYLTAFMYDNPFEYLIVIGLR